MDAVPLPRSDRAPLLDVLRGLALLAVVAVNAPWFFQASGGDVLQPLAAGPDPWTARAVAFLFQGKAYALLAMLFGAGLALQQERLDAAGARASRLLLRRLLVLLGFGLAHGLLLWSGDILATYAVIGLALLLFRRRRPRTLLVWALVLLGLSFLLSVAAGGLLVVVSTSAPELLARLNAGIDQATAAKAAASLRAYGTGPYGALFRERAGDFLRQGGGGILGLGPMFLGLLLLGNWSVRAGVVRAALARAAWLPRATAILGAIGLSGEVARLLLLERGGLGLAILGFGISIVSGPAAALAGAAALAWLAQDPGRLRWLRPVASLGRVSLTAYLLQSLVFTTASYFYGGGLYGSLRPATLLGLALAAWLAEVALAALWLGRFEVGLAEWLWRRLAYGRSIPLRRPTPAALAAPAGHG